MKGVQCYELFGGIALKITHFHFHFSYCHIVCLFHVLTCTMHSAFNLLVFPNSMFTSLLLFFNERAVCSLEK